MLFLLLTGLAALLYNSLIREQLIDYDALIRQSLVDVQTIERVLGTKPLYVIDTSDGRYYAVVDSASGYQSQVETLSIADEGGRLAAVLITKENETPIFFRRLYEHGFFDGFKGLSAKEPIYFAGAPGYSGYLGNVPTDNYIDAVSGSTISTHAVTEAVNKGTLTISRMYFSNAWNNPYDLPEINSNTLAVVLVFLLALLGSFIKIMGRLRLGFLVVSIALLGFTANQFVTLPMLHSVSQLQIPWVTNIKWYVLLVGSLAVILFTGKNIYCGWICPFGALQEVLNRLAGFKPLTASPPLLAILRLAGPTLLWLAIMLGTGLNNYGTLDYQPFGAMFLFRGSWVQWLILPVLLIMSLFYRRFYCQFFCPVGFLYNLLTRWRNKGVKACQKVKLIWGKVTTRVN